MTPFHNPSPAAVEAFLRTVQRIAVVGLSPDPERDSHGVARGLQRRGFQIVPIRPGVEEILGEPAYPSLREVPGKLDLVDVFRAPEHVPAIVEECLELKIPAIWLQDGVVAPEAAARAQAAGMFVVMDDCLGRVSRRLDLKVGG